MRRGKPLAICAAFLTKSRVCARDFVGKLTIIISNPMGKLNQKYFDMADMLLKNFRVAGTNGYCFWLPRDETALLLKLIYSMDEVALKGLFEQLKGSIQE